jgi:hypothetical protein
MVRPLHRLLEAPATVGERGEEERRSVYLKGVSWWLRWVVVVVVVVLLVVGSGGVDRRSMSCFLKNHTQPADRRGDQRQRLWAVAFGRATHTDVCRGAHVRARARVCVCVCVQLARVCRGCQQQRTIENGRTICARGSRGDTRGTSSSTQSFRRSGCTGLGVSEKGGKGGTGRDGDAEEKKRRQEGRSEDNAEKGGASQRGDQTPQPTQQRWNTSSAIADREGWATLSSIPSHPIPSHPIPMVHWEERHPFSAFSRCFSRCPRAPCGFKSNPRSEGLEVRRAYRGGGCL